jgi:hypothetical protein
VGGGVAVQQGTDRVASTGPAQALKQISDVPRVIEAGLDRGSRGKRLGRAAGPSLTQALQELGDI